MIIFTGAPTMTMCLIGNPTDALGEVVTTDAPNGALPPGDTGEAQDNAAIAENDMSDSGNISCLFGGLLACFFQGLWYAVLMGRWRRRVVDP
jgi:hypothetical protein